MTYDKAGRKLTMSDPDMGNWNYSYNALGNLTTQTDARLHNQSRLRCSEPHNWKELLELSRDSRGYLYL